MILPAAVGVFAGPLLERGAAGRDGWRTLEGDRRRAEAQEALEL